MKKKYKIKLIKYKKFRKIKKIFNDIYLINEIKINYFFYTIKYIYLNLTIIIKSNKR